MTPLDIALNRMAEIRGELAELETFVRVYYRIFPQEKLASIFPEGVGKAIPKMPVDNSGKPVDKPVDNEGVNGEGEVLARDQDRPKSAPRMKLARAKEIFGGLFEKHISAARKPLTRNELLVLLESDPSAPQLPAGTADERAKYLGTLLWRNKRYFRNLPGHGYWIRSRPYPPANYDPETDSEMARVLDSEVGFAERPIRTTIKVNPGHPIPKDAVRAYEELVENIRDHDRRYYTNDAPTISDADYDNLKRRQADLEKEYPELTDHSLI